MKLVCVGNTDSSRFTSKCPLTVGRIYYGFPFPLHNGLVLTGNDVGFLVCDDTGEWNIYKSNLFLSAS